MPKMKQDREVTYPELEVRHCYGPDALTADKAREFLGWAEETKEDPFGDDYWIRDANGKKVRALNNYNPKAGIYNRPLDREHALSLAQDILNRAWSGPTTMPGETVNGETVVIGRYGRVLSAQHRLAALVFAHQIWSSDAQKYHWQEKWPSATYPLGPVIDTLVVLGVSEDKRVTRTIDNVKPRSISDMLFTDEGFFPKASETTRVELVKVVEHAVRLLWKRTGADTDAFSPHRTHAQVVDFLERHKKLKSMVDFIYTENAGTDKRRQVKRYIGLGYASALAYLMAASASDYDDYNTAEVPSEKKIDFSRWDKAQEFWQGLAQDWKELRHVILARRPNAEGDGLNGHIFADSEDGGTTMERVSTLIKAWNTFVEHGKVLPSDLGLTYVTDEDGDRFLNDFPTVGGVDRGERKVQEPEEEGAGEEPTAEEPAPEPEVIPPPAEEETPEQERARREAVEANGNGEPEKPAKKTRKKKVKVEE